MFKRLFDRSAKPRTIWFTDQAARGYVKSTGGVVLRADPEAAAHNAESEHPSFVHGNDSDDDLTLRQIRNALEEGNQLTQSNMYFGNPRLNASYYARRIEGLDAAKSDDEPDTITEGGTATSGMRQTLIAQFPIESYAFWPETTPEGQYISRRSMQSKNDPERIAGPFKCGPGEFLWSEINTDTYRLWKATNQALEMGAYNVKSGKSDAADAFLGVSSHTWEGGQQQHAKPTPQRDSSEDITGVGAESWVGKRSNSTGYRITTGDSKRPGIVRGSTAAALVARRTSGMAKINEMNRRAWAKA